MTIEPKILRRTQKMLNVAKSAMWNTLVAMSNTVNAMANPTPALCMAVLT